MTSIAEQVRRLRGDRSQADLADIAGLPQARVAEVEGGANVKLARLVEIARALGAPLVVYPDAEMPEIQRRPEKKKKKG